MRRPRERVLPPTGDRLRLIDQIELELLLRLCREAEADIGKGNPIEGAHHRAIVAAMQRLVPSQ